jgi:hypothetical protein
MRRVLIAVTMATVAWCAPARADDGRICRLRLPESVNAWMWIREHVSQCEKDDVLDISFITAFPTPPDRAALVSELGASLCRMDMRVDIQPHEFFCVYRGAPRETSTPKS